MIPTIIFSSFILIIYFIYYKLCERNCRVEYQRKSEIKRIKRAYMLSKKVA